MQKYYIEYTLRNGETENVTITTYDLFDSLFQYERNRDIKSWDLIKLV